MNKKFLRVVQVDAAQTDSSADQVKYKKVLFRGVTLVDGMLIMDEKVGTRVLWPFKYKRTMNGVEQVMTGNFDFDTIKAGDMYSGEIKHFDTTPYRINEGGREITSWSGVIFDSDPNGGLSIAARSVEQNGAKILVDDGTGSGAKIPFILNPQPKAVTNDVEP